MLKIALYNLTTTTKHGGVESFVWEIARRLSERGHDVTLLGGRGDVLRPYRDLTVLRYPYVAREAWGRVPPLRKLRSYVEQARPPMPQRYETYNLLQHLGVATIFTPEFLATVDARHPEQLLVQRPTFGTGKLEIVRSPEDTAR